jgi:hypothetical protein
VLVSSQDGWVGRLDSWTAFLELWRGPACSSGPAAAPATARLAMPTAAPHGGLQDVLRAAAAIRALQVKVTTDSPRPGLLLHWAVEDWQLPPEVVLPPGTKQAGGGAVQTPFRDGESVSLTFPEVGRVGMRRRSAAP